MEHVSKINGKTYEIGSIMGYGGKGSYDMVVILEWENDFDPPKDNGPVEIVSFYFGEYNYDDTEYYIQKHVEGE